MERQITVVSVNADRVPGRLDRMCRRGQVGIGVLETEAAWSLIGELGHIGHRHADHRLGAAGPWRWHQYLLASKKFPQARHLHCIVITWLPNNEMTSVSFERQNGNFRASTPPPLARMGRPTISPPPLAWTGRPTVSPPPLARTGRPTVSPPPLAGEGRVGAASVPCLGTGGHVPLFGEALQHAERQLVDAARADAPADRVPRF